MSFFLFAWSMGVLISLAPDKLRPCGRRCPTLMYNLPIASCHRISFSRLTTTERVTGVVFPMPEASFMFGSLAMMGFTFPSPTIYIL